MNALMAIAGRLRDAWNAQSASRRRAVLWIFQLALTAGIVFYVNKSISSSSLGGVVAGLPRGVLYPVLGSAALLFLLQSLRWQRVVAAHGYTIKFTDACRSFAWGNTVALFTPARAGELLRGFVLTGIPKSRTVSCVVVDKICAGMAVLAGSVCALAIGAVGFGDHIPLWFGCVVVVSTVVAGVLLWFLAQGDLHRIGFIPRRIQTTIHEYRSRLDFKIMPAAFLISVICQAVLVCQTGMLFGGLGIIPAHNGFFAAAHAYALMMMIPFLIANMGIREFSFLFFLAQGMALSASKESLAVVSGAASLIILTVNIVLPAAVGAVWSLISRSKKPISQSL